MNTHYLIIGASHAGLSALDAIRRWDAESSLTLVSAEKKYLYSPTVLPYVISGKTKAGSLDIRPSGYFSTQNVHLVKGAVATRVDTAGRRVIFNDGLLIVNYDKLLIATGASASVPSIDGLDNVDFFTVRTLSDARNIKDKISVAGSALVVGAGFVGMHVAENLANAGLNVTVIESLNRIMGSSFDSDASSRIQQVFSDKGVRFLTGVNISKIVQKDNRTTLIFTDGSKSSADILVVATGITPRTDFLSNSGIELGRGIIVDDRMHTSAENIWAAGDVARAPSFFSSEKSVGGTIPSATDQGKTAGMDMADDPYLKAYPGNLNMNTFNFFNQSAFSIGNVADGLSTADSEIHTQSDLESNGFCKFVLQDNVLTGVSAVNMRLHSGILKEMILRKVDLSGKKEIFLSEPLGTSRQLMREFF